MGHRPNTPVAGFLLGTSGNQLGAILPAFCSNLIGRNLRRWSAGVTQPQYTDIQNKRGKPLPLDFGFDKGGFGTLGVQGGDNGDGLFFITLGSYSLNRIGLSGHLNKVSGVSVQVSGTTRISRAGLDSAELVAGYADHILKWAVI